MTQARGDEELINLYKNGDEEVFKELIEKYTSPIFNYTARMVGKEEASDLTQDVFIKVWKNLKKFNIKKASFKTWIFSIAKNTVTDFLRKKKSLVFSDIDNKEDEIPFSETIEDTDILPDEVLQKIQDTEKLNIALEKLSILNKNILILHYQEEMTFDEIGKILNKPLNTVKSYHRRAILELRKML